MFYSTFLGRFTRPLIMYFAKPFFQKLSAGTPISCGSSPPGGNPPSAGGFCGMTEAMLNSKFGPNVNFGKCKAGSNKCKVSCKNGRKPSPKKLKCKGGRITASSIRC